MKELEEAVEFLKTAFESRGAKVSEEDLKFMIQTILETFGTYGFGYGISGFTFGRSGYHSGEEK